MVPLEIKTAEETVREIMEGYNRRPKGWQIASDFRGNTLVLGPEEGFRLKLMMISPSENLGVGTRIDDADELRRSIGTDISSGFRGLSMGAARDIFTSLDRASDDAKRQEALHRLLQIEPVSTMDLQSMDLGAIVSGPYIAHPDLRMISKRQSELDERLALAVDRSFRAKYPMRSSMYR